MILCPFPSPLPSLIAEYQETLDAQRAIAVAAKARLTPGQLLELRDWLFEEQADLLAFLTGDVPAGEELRILREWIEREDGK